jgi:spore protease
MISGIVPGVMARTGMETMEIVKGVVESTNPDLIVAVDALAARSTRRLNRTIQITNTGIHPGSGVGNHRGSLNQETLGKPVIAIGIPTVVDAATIVNDAIGSKFEEIPLTNMAELSNMYVTGKDIDETVKRLAYTISEGINMALKYDR